MILLKKSLPRIVRRYSLRIEVIFLTKHLRCHRGKYQTGSTYICGCMHNKMHVNSSENGCKFWYMCQETFRLVSRTCCNKSLQGFKIFGLEMILSSRRWYYIFRIITASELLSFALLTIKLVQKMLQYFLHCIVTLR